MSSSSADEAADDASIAVILNPSAAGGRTTAALPAINRALTQTRRPYAIHVTKCRGDAIEIARRVSDDGANLVIAVGGDGTINEVTNGLLASGRKPTLGIVAVGHGSDFARTVGTSKNVELAIAAACSLRPRPIDAGQARFADGSTRAFLNVAGLGFDAIVAERVGGSRLPGSNLPYLSAALRTLTSFRNIPIHITVDGTTIETRAVFAQIANARFMGGGFKIAPMAEIDDGWLDLALVGDLAKGDLLKNLPKVYSGGHVDHPKFTHRTMRSAHISSDEPAKVQLDGEIVGTTPVTFSVLPGAVQFAG